MKLNNSTGSIVWRGIIGPREGLLGALSVNSEYGGIKEITLMIDVYSPTDKNSAEDYAFELDRGSNLNGKMIDLILAYYGVWTYVARNQDNQQNDDMDRMNIGSMNGDRELMDERIYRQEFRNNWRWVFDFDF